ncbi:MAG TPA: S8 family serine peptidase [Solirubrobacteraceae bacterium]|nr:S8 family serine peptidase [Solirubrobacteraceae bacterium]
MRALLFSTFTALAVLTGLGAAQANAAVDPLRDSQWALDAIHLASAPSGTPSGAGALVAVIDSGVDATHPDLAGRVVPGIDVVDGDADPSDPTGHGTHIAGLIAAAAGNGIGGAGVAPAARILAVRVLGTDNDGTAANVAAGIDSAVDAGADVINLSLNWSDPSPALAPVTAAMQRAADHGVLLVVAAGNDARGRCEEPVLPQKALCVGSLSSNLRLSPFSSYGQGLGLVAPGDDLVSTWNDGAYRTMSGTSQAAALTSGVAALLVGLGLHGDDLMQRLLATARDIGTPGPDARSGAGMLDAERAVEGATQGTMPPVLEATSATRTLNGSVLRRGMTVGCDAAMPGTCRVKVRVGKTVVARGSAPVDGTGMFDVVARATKAGRRMLGGGRTLRGSVETSLAGATSVRSRLALRAR